MRADKLHPLLREPVSPRDGVAGVERPQELFKKIPDQPVALLGLANRHIVSARQFGRDQILQLCRLAALYEISAGGALFQRPLVGKIMITAFSEPSTRTRLSFESAWHRLGGDIMSITDVQSTGVAKGESLQDVAEMFSNYGDVVVLRDNDEQSVYRMLEALRIPIINAGNGIDEHPTQALADLYTILKWRPALIAESPDPVRLGIIGSPGRMRTVRSLLLLMSLFSDAISEVVIFSGEAEAFSPDQREELEEAGLKLRISDSLRSELPELDIVYINSIAWVGDTYEKLTGDIKLTVDSPIKDGAIVLHPLARGDELDVSLDRAPANWYFAQARGAVFVRMALLTCLVQRVSRVLDAPAPSAPSGGF